MFCDEMLEEIEAIAAGDLTPDARMAAHLASCRNCRATLDRAREVERLMRQRPAPQAPPHFTSRTLARIRRDKWRRDQLLDAGFNAAVAGLVLAVVVGVWLIINRSGIVTVSNDAFGLIQTYTVAFVRRIAPALPRYAAATVLLAAAVGIWWWAERDLSL